MSFFDGIFDDDDEDFGFAADAGLTKADDQSLFGAGFDDTSFAGQADNLSLGQRAEIGFDAFRGAPSGGALGIIGAGIKGVAHGLNPQKNPDPFAGQQGASRLAHLMAGPLSPAISLVEALQAATGEKGIPDPVAEDMGQFNGSDLDRPGIEQRLKRLELLSGGAVEKDKDDKSPFLDRAFERRLRGALI